MRFYYNIAGLYMLASAVAYPVLCVLAWMLLRKAARKRLRSFLPWLTPSAVGATLTTGAILLLAFVTYSGRRDYALAAVSYLLSLGGLMSSVVSFARLWRIIAALPPDEGEQGRMVDEPRQEGVWPPRPQV